MPRILNLAAIIVGVLALLAGMTFAALRSSRPPARERDLGSIVEDLSHADPVVAQEAERELERRWPGSRPLLEEASRSDDPALSRRARRLLDRLTPPDGGIE